MESKVTHLNDFLAFVVCEIEEVTIPLLMFVILSIDMHHKIFVLSNPDLTNYFVFMLGWILSLVLLDLKHPRPKALGTAIWHWWIWVQKTQSQTPNPSPPNNHKKSVGCACVLYSPVDARESGPHVFKPPGSKCGYLTRTWYCTVLLIIFVCFHYLLLY